MNVLIGSVKSSPEMSITCEVVSGLPSHLGRTHGLYHSRVKQTKAWTKGTVRGSQMDN